MERILIVAVNLREKFTATNLNRIREKPPQQKIQAQERGLNMPKLTLIEELDTCLY